jgi:hypothetical protein
MKRKEFSVSPSDSSLKITLDQNHLDEVIEFILMSRNANLLVTKRDGAVLVTSRTKKLPSSTCRKIVQLLKSNNFSCIGYC